MVIFACAADPLFMATGPLGIGALLAHWALFTMLLAWSWARIRSRRPKENPHV